MTKLAIRNTILAIVADSREYDAGTVVIHKDGSVTARKDADKTATGNDSRRYLVGYVDEMVTAAGERRPGW